MSLLSVPKITAPVETSGSLACAPAVETSGSIAFISTPPASSGCETAGSVASSSCESSFSTIA